MHNSQKNILVSKRQFSTQNSATPKKTPLVPLTQESHQSNFSNHKSISGENNSTGAGVSYSQLQIILQNVQNAKKKAAEHIHGLESKNKQLEDELTKTKDEVRRYVHLQQTIKAERRAVESKYEGELLAVKQELIKRDDIISQLNDRISRLNDQISQKSKQLTNSKQICNRTQIELQKVSFIHTNFTTVLQITQNSHEFRHIVENYGDIPKLLDSIKVNQVTRISKESAIEELKTTVEQLRVQIHHNNKLINSISQQNKNLVKLVAQTAEQKIALSLNLKQSEQQVMNKQQESQSAVSELHNKIQQSNKHSEQKIAQKQQTIAKLSTKIGKLQRQLIEAEERERNFKAESTFKSVVDEVCNEFEDYENVMNRLKYLEKIRSEFYFNVEKIQYLCKMLDE